jgi:hypothetical protein
MLAAPISKLRLILTSTGNVLESGSLVGGNTGGRGDFGRLNSGSSGWSIRELWRRQLYIYLVGHLLFAPRCEGRVARE